jgi:hypothetical protein
VDDLFRVSKLVELLLLAGASFYLGNQFGKPKEVRHWHRLRRRITKPRMALPPDVCNRSDDEPNDLS